MATPNLSDTARRAAGRLGRSLGGRARTERDADTADVSAEDAVELGHRLILGRSPDPDFWQATKAAIAAGNMTAAQVWAGMAGSPEFAARVAHQRAIIEAAQPPSTEGYIDVNELRAAKSIEEHNAAAEGYFASQDRATIERMLVKPFESPSDLTELLCCFAHVATGLRLLPGDTVLDFGAGSGWTSWNFAQLGCEVICSDVAPAALGIARERFDRWPLGLNHKPPIFLLFNGHRLDLPDSSVDKICCFDAFHHLINQSEVMAEFARVLKPGGLIGFDEPGRHHSTSIEAQFEMRAYGVVEGDIDVETIAAMATRVGLEFVAADMLTTRPVWLELEEFTDLVNTRVPNASAVQRVANQVHSKQLFILRKPGGPGPDSRDRLALGGRLELNDFTTDFDADSIRVRVHLTVRNTGTGRWLSSDNGLGWVQLGVRVDDSNAGGIRIDTDQPLTLEPGEQRQIDGTFFVRRESKAQQISINLVSELVAWFDTCGTPALEITLPPDPV